MRVGLVGLGMGAIKHGQALKTLAGRVEVAGVWSRDAGRRAHFAATHGLPEAASLEALIDDPSIGLAILVTPPWTHLELTSRFAAAGKHVLLEKPVEGTLERAEALVAICEAAGVTLGVVFQNRFRAPHRRLAEIAAAGRLGRVLSASAAIRWWRPDTYYAQPGRGMKATDAGGVLLTQAIHSLDQLIAFAGPAEAVRGFHATTPLRRIDTEDVAAGAVRWRSGALGVVDATTAAYPGTSERIDLACEHGTALLERKRIRIRLRDGTEIDEEEAPDTPEYLPHLLLIEDMLDAIATGRQPQANGRGSLDVHRLIDMLMRDRE
jgi:UDP-N-acetyl-2-amino-2-deoxyglucuronate dehydrogenase